LIVAPVGLALEDQMIGRGPTNNVRHLHGLLRSVQSRVKGAEQGLRAERLVQYRHHTSARDFVDADGLMAYGQNVADF
jgi:hypothetical protein